MKQYKKLLETILEKGTHKSAAREGMPGTTSYFGYQFRHNLAEGFPMLTTKKVPWKGVVYELLWFLRGDTNIKYLDKNNVTYMWHEDAYNYYVKVLEEQKLYPLSFNNFKEVITNNTSLETLQSVHGGIPRHYQMGDCGMQYGALWRRWNNDNDPVQFSFVDQIKDLIKGLKENPMSRRHIVSAWNPATLNDMALNACHALVQFNCRPLTARERENLIPKETPEHLTGLEFTNTPQYYLDCQMYQRSADVFLGVPLNIASYSLLTHILAKICNMIPGDFIHTFGDVHIYDNHLDQVKEQLTREEKPLPTLNLELPCSANEFEFLILEGGLNADCLISALQNYNPHPSIKGKLSTGLQ